jgi:uncharacterized protein YukE
VTDRLVVNTETLRDLSTNLATVHTTLTSAAADSRDLGAMIPHARLAHEIDDFSSQWDRRREELIGQVDALQQRTAAVADTFEQADLELATAIEMPED